MTYRIIVEFQRDLKTDAEVIGKKKPTDLDLIIQFRSELQHAYDESELAGLFVIKKVIRS